MSTAKSITEMINDSCTRAENELFNIYEFSDNCMMVINNNTNGEYYVEIDNENLQVLNCTCPHYNFKAGPLGFSCKHMIAVANYLGYNW